MTVPQIISIVTPSFDQGDYIDETIQSVIGQEGNFYIDYIIMDGGSTDNTLDVISKYENLILSETWRPKCRGIKFRWTSEADRGQSHAINKGWRLAEGDLLAWINSDDYYAPGAFERAVRVLSEDPSVMMTYGDLYFINQKDSTFFYQRYESFDYLSLLRHRIGVSQPGSFMKKSVLESVGYLDEELHLAMDFDFWLRLAKVGKIQYVPSAFAYYRIHQDAKSSSYPERWRKEILQVLAKTFEADPQLSLREKSRAWAETYRHVARLFLSSHHHAGLFHSCLMATIMHPPLLWNSDLCGYWIYALLGVRIGDYLKKAKHKVKKRDA